MHERAKYQRYDTTGGGETPAVEIQAIQARRLHRRLRDGTRGKPHLRFGFLELRLELRHVQNYSVTQWVR